jgi:hypothetical protein
LPNRRHGPAGFYVNQRLISRAKKCIGRPGRRRTMSLARGSGSSPKASRASGLATLRVVGDRLAAKLRWSRYAPARHNQFALTIHAVAHDRRKLVRKDPGE